MFAYRVLYKGRLDKACPVRKFFLSPHLLINKGLIMENMEDFKKFETQIQKIAEKIKNQKQLATNE